MSIILMDIFSGVCAIAGALAGAYVGYWIWWRE